LHFKAKAAMARSHEACSIPANLIGTAFLSNPAIFPLFFECEAPDVLMVHITPADRPELPKTSPAIMNRMQEISFSTSLIRVAFLNKLIDEGEMGGGKRMLVHLIEAEDLIRGFSWSSRLNSDWRFLTHLYEMGRERADTWLQVNFDSIGVESTVDLTEKYF
jgi:NTE family protein